MIAVFLQGLIKINPVLTVKCTQFSQRCQMNDLLEIFLIFWLFMQNRGYLPRLFWLRFCWEWWACVQNVLYKIHARPQVPDFWILGFWKHRFVLDQPPSRIKIQCWTVKVCILPKSSNITNLDKNYIFGKRRKQRFKN